MPKQKDLPGVDGDGVAPVKIPAIEAAADAYITERDKRCRQTPKEIAAKGKLIDAIHGNAEKLPRNEDGAIVYKNNDIKITLAPGKEKLKVKEIEDDDGSED